MNGDDDEKQRQKVLDNVERALSKSADVKTENGKILAFKRPDPKPKKDD